MKNLVRAGAVAAMAAGLVTAGMTSASATVGPTASFAGVLTGGPGAVNVLINYSCSADVSPLNHLFVAVKQGPEVNNTDHTSSQYANTFYSTNWKSDSGPNALICDGAQHTQNIVLKPQPADFGWTPIVPRLSAGPALVQICVYDNVTGFTDQGEPIGGFAPSYTMENVQAGKGASK